MLIRTLIIVVLAIAALSGCGRRGALEAPGATTSAAPAVVGAAPNAVSPLDPGSGGPPPAPEEAPSATPKRHFFLDFLL